MNLPNSLAIDVAVRSRQGHYGDAVTRRSWDEVAAMFTADCEVSLDLRDGVERHFVGGRAIAEFIAAAIERFSFFAFTITNSAVTVVDADHATARLYIKELRHDHDGQWSEAHGLYEDTYRHEDGVWKFAARRYSSLARVVADGSAVVTFPIPT